MVNKILINETMTIDVNIIDMDVFGESLLCLIPRIEEICKIIDRQVNKLASVPYISYVSAEEHCGYIIDNICIKNELVNLHKVFKYWYGLLKDKDQELLDSYFIEKDARVYRRKDRYITPLIRMFMRYIHIMFDAKEKDLLKNPYVYYEFKHVLNRIEKQKSGVALRNSHKGGHKYDSTTNEKRDS